MSRFRKLFSLTLIMLVTLAFPATQSLAAPSLQIPGTGYNTAFRVQNLSAQVAHCAYELHKDSDGSTAFSASLPDIAVNASAYVYMPSVQGVPTGTFSAIVSCDQPVAAVVNYSNANRGDTYVGTSSPAATLYIPSAYNNYYGYYTTYRVQNASTSAQSVQVDYYGPGSATAVKTVTVSIPGNGAADVNQQGIAELSANTPYSAKLTATGGGTLAAVAQIYGSGSVANQLYAFSAFTGGATTYYAPVIMSNYYGYNSATTIQNIGASDATVTLTYSGPSGDVKTNNYTIAPNSSQTVLDYSELAGQAARGTTLYSERVTSTNSQPLIVTVNESTPTTNRAGTYGAFPSGGKSFVAPIVMKRYYDYNSSITCQNVGSGTTNVSVSYTGTDASNNPVTVATKVVLSSLATGASGLIYQPGETGLPDGFIGSATITSDAQNVVCVVNQDQNEGAPALATNDQLYAYDAIAKP